MAGTHPVGFLDKTPEGNRPVDFLGKSPEDIPQESYSVLIHHPSSQSHRSDLALVLAPVKK
jgi:hypothetical protein